MLQQSDSTFVTGKASDNDGTFNIPIRTGNFIVHISFIGYNDIYENVQVTAAEPNVRLGEVEMTHDNILLSETVVTAKAPEIVVKGDTLSIMRTLIT